MLFHANFKFRIPTTKTEQRVTRCKIALVLSEARKFIEVLLPDQASPFTQFVFYVHRNLICPFRVIFRFLDFIALVQRLRGSTETIKNGKYPKEGSTITRQRVCFFAY